MIQRGSHSIQNGLPEGLQTNADADGAPPLPPRTAIIFTPLPAVSKPQGKTTKKKRSNYLTEWRSENYCAWRILFFKNFYIFEASPIFIIKILFL
jgi:hypothetical protein